MNIRSITKHFENLTILVSQLSFNFDLILLTETFEITELDLFKIQGYSIIYNGENFNQNDGIIVYLKDYLNYRYELVPIELTTALEVHIS